MFFNLPSNGNSLCLLVTIGFSIAPDPFPPEILTDNTFSISKFCWSTNISFKLPLITGWTRAVIPDPTFGTEIVAGLITSKSFPWFNILNSDNGPKNILSNDL